MTCKVSCIFVVSLLYLVNLEATTVQNASLHHRSKRSSTTICVEIRPSTPQEEPYFMCKGADFPKIQRGGITSLSPTATNYKHNKPENSFEIGSNFQNPTYDTNTNYQDAPLHNSETYYQSMPTPTAKSNGFRAKSFHNPESAFRPDDNKSPFRHTEASFQQSQQPIIQADQTPFQRPPAFSHTDNAPTAFRYEQPATQNVPPQSQHAQPVISFGPSGNPAPTQSFRNEPSIEQPSTYHGKSNAAQTQSAVNRGYGAGPKSNIHASAIANRNFQHDGSTTTNDGAATATEFAAEPSIAPAHKSAPFDQSGAAQRFPFTHEDAAREIPQQNGRRNEAARPTSSTTATGFNSNVAPAFAKTTTTNLMPTGVHFSNNKYRERQPQHNYRPHEEPILGAPPMRQQQRLPTLTDEELMNTPNWGFAPEELQIFRTMPNNEDYAVEPPRDALPLPRTMPAEYYDDPVMQQFYASLQDSNTLGATDKQPAKQQFKAATRTSGCENCGPYQQTPIASVYPLAKTEQCADKPTAYAPQQYVGGAANYNNYPPTAPNACPPQRDYGLQPIFITLPCFGQQQGPPVNGYDNVGMAGPLAKLFMRPFAPFGAPLIPNFFNPFNLLAAPQTGAYADANMMQPGFNYNPNYKNMQKPEGERFDLVGMAPPHNIVGVTTTTEHSTTKNTETTKHMASDATQNQEEEEEEEAEEEQSETEEEVHDNGSEEGQNMNVPQLIGIVASTAPMGKVTPTAKTKKYKAAASTFVSAPATPTSSSTTTTTRTTTTTLSDEAAQRALGDEQDKSFEVSKKTFKAMLGAAKSLTSITKTEFPEATPTASTTEGRIEKRQNPLRSGSSGGTNVGTYKLRKYVQKL